MPESTNVAPVYSPALVAFVPFGENDIGWVPLGPGDVYVPHYYNTSWQPYYLTRDNLYQRGVNLNVPGAVTVVSVDDFNRDFDWRRARKADRNMLAIGESGAGSVAADAIAECSGESAWGRGKIDIPPGIARKLNDTTVITSTTPVAPPFRPDLAKAMRVNTASDRAKGQKFKVRDERQGRGAPQTAQTTRQPAAPGPPRKPQRDTANSQRELHQVEQQQRQQQNEQRRVELLLQRKLNVRRDLCDSNNPRVNASQHQRDRNQQQQRRAVVPQQRPQPQMRRESAPVRSQRSSPLDPSRDLLLHLVRSRSRSNSKSRKRLDVLPQPDRFRAVVKAKHEALTQGTQINTDLNPNLSRLQSVRPATFARSAA